MKLEVGKYYKTKNGYKVRIYSTDAGGCYPIHGAIYSNSNIGWALGQWTHNGSNGSNELLNIVGEWEELVRLIAWRNRTTNEIYMRPDNRKDLGAIKYERCPWLDQPLEENNVH